MGRIKRIAIFSIPDHFYINMMLGLKRGLEALGVEAFVCWPHLNGQDLASFTDNYQPDVVLEMDRFRDQIDNFHEPINHVAWVLNHVVFGRRVNVNATGSVATYFVTDPREVGFENLPDGSYDYLLPACDPTVFKPRPAAAAFDFSFVGHMYGPLSQQELDKDIAVDGRFVAKVGEIVDLFMASNIWHWNLDLHHIDYFLRDFFARHGISLGNNPIPPGLMYLFDEYLIRLKDRHRVGTGLLNVSGKVGFYGNPEWTQWPEFAPHYRGTLFRASDLAQVICSTRVNVHNGPLTMHMRVLEVLGCGMPLMVNRSTRDSTPVGIERHFSPGDHYIPYDLDDIEEVAARALRNEESCRRIGASALARVHEAHTWRHRAEFLLRDLEQRINGVAPA